ncbi:MAG: hypothetical protein AAGE52_10170 [Myxococcota bacterium]
MDPVVLSFGPAYLLELLLFVCAPRFLSRLAFVPLRHVVRVRRRPHADGPVGYRSVGRRGAPDPALLWDGRDSVARWEGPYGWVKWKLNLFRANPRKVPGIARIRVGGEFAELSARVLPFGVVTYVCGMINLSIAVHLLGVTYEMYELLLAVCGASALWFTLSAPNSLAEPTRRAMDAVADAFEA